LTNFSFLLQRFANFLLSQNWKKKNPMVHSYNHHLFICDAPDKRKERDKEKKGGGEGGERGLRASTFFKLSSSA
jgi:hypothetical protein